eukprot:2284993-Prymnesium_polylepis.1
MHLLGAGALGSLFAAHLPHSTLLLRRGKGVGPRLRVCVTRGWMDAGSAASAHEALLAADTVDGHGAIDFLVVATKAFHVQEAIASVEGRLRDRAKVVLLCNGALSLADLRLPATTSLLAATTTHGAWLQPSSGDATRRVHHAGNGDTWVGPLTAGREAAGGG